MARWYVAAALAALLVSSFALLEASAAHKITFCNHCSKGPIHVAVKVTKSGQALPISYCWYEVPFDTCYYLKDTHDDAIEIDDGDSFLYYAKGKEFDYQWDGEHSFSCKGQDLDGRSFSREKVTLTCRERRRGNETAIESGEVEEEAIRGVAPRRIPLDENGPGRNLLRP
ncbi:unnamed protein product [Vitrella brassicaformis CCMP3155]|uniref:GOLD domain-containing protein n=1 Tax=Vitrella brassicaformis (strain CCMP3155) TaxID=1169540 RepID=A0A0G4F6V2_VITBC|nr:unnamed protein product [Vitrella brassicaformis CCMP3155]|eukprot:CEM08209.1 unnamed protein product [Vitrella brassicaformis CCMP3155]